MLLNDSKKINKLILLSEGLLPICSDLSKIGIHTFSVLINYDDGRQINLSNNPKWINDYYKFSLYESSLYDRDPTLFTTGYNLWLGSLHLPVYQHGLHYYDSGVGLTICHREQDYSAFYFFSGSSKNPQLLTFMVNNYNFLENFIVFFMKKSKSLLKKALLLNMKSRNMESNKFKINEAVQQSIYKYEKLCQLKHIIELKMGKSLANNSLLLGFPLSSRQKQVIYWSAKGKSAKQTAILLGISPRTVERHFEILREKTGTACKQELLIKAMLESPPEDWLFDDDPGT